MKIYQGYTPLTLKPNYRSRTTMIKALFLPCEWGAAMIPSGFTQFNFSQCLSHQLKINHLLLLSGFNNYSNSWHLSLVPDSDEDPLVRPQTLMSCYLAARGATTIFKMFPAHTTHPVCPTDFNASQSAGATTPCTPNDLCKVSPQPSRPSYFSFQIFLP